MRKVLLINPPFYRLMNSHYNGLSLGLSYIAAVLSEAKHEVRIYNADQQNRKNYAKLKEIFDSYNNYKEILSDLNHPLWLEIKDVIKDYSPDIVGITMMTGTYKSAENIGRIAKEVNEKIVVVVGGTHPTILPEETIKNKYFDYIIRGEGEYSFLDLVNNVKKENIAGLTYINEKGIIINNSNREFIKNINSLPFPSRDLYINDNKYIDFGYIITGRGCPFKCTFCASNEIWKGHVRFRTPENVIEEIKYVYNKYDTRFFYFVDDTLTLNKKKTKKICNLIIENNLKIKWICTTRVDTIDEELLCLMKEAGCIRIKLGIESGSERILKLINKNITKKQIRDSVSLIKKVGIDISAYLMIGFPTETNEEVQETLDFARELNPTYYSLSILAPYPGTKIYNDIIKSGIKLPMEHWEYFFHYSKDMILANNIDSAVVDECLSLNEAKGKERI